MHTDRAKELMMHVTIPYKDPRANKDQEDREFRSPTTNTQGQNTKCYIAALHTQHKHPLGSTLRLYTFCNLLEVYSIEFALTQGFCGCNAYPALLA